MIMRTKFVIFGVWNILHLFMFFKFSSSFKNYYENYSDSPSLDFEYNRLAEIEKHCSQYLSSGSKLDLTDSKIERIKKELSFVNGEWKQDNNGFAPLMPLDVSDLSLGIVSPPLNLVNFEVKDVKSLGHMQNGVCLGGVMSIGITLSSPFSPIFGTKFSMNPSMSIMTIVFEGVFVQSEEIMRERLLCLLGKTTLPTRRWLLGPDNQCPNPVQDDQIVLVLRYPNTSNLTKHATIHGEMRSLNEKENLKYFDKVLISSKPGWYSNESNSCNPYAHLEELIEDGSNNLSGSDFCKILQDVSNEVFNILPDYHTIKSNTNDAGKLGPFLLGSEVKFVDKNYAKVKLVMHNVKCKVNNSRDKTNNAEVSIVFRVIIHGPTDKSMTSSSRTNLSSGMTLSAKGTWDSSTGMLCMIGSVPKGEEAQVSLYFPRVLSIRQRSIVFGTISSPSYSKDSFSPLHFNVIRSPAYLEYMYGWYTGSYLSYNYSKIKIKQADELRRRSESFKESILRYPAIQEEGGLFPLSQLYDLPVELRVGIKLGTSRLNGAQMRMDVEVLSIGPFLARYDYLYKVRHESTLENVKTLLNEDELMKVSLHLTFSEKLSHESVSLMSLEGLYDPHTGVMYLIGCAHVDARNASNRGLDCLIEAKIQYAPRNSQRLKDKVAEINIISKRNPDDPHYFSPIEIP